MTQEDGEVTLDPSLIYEETAEEKAAAQPEETEVQEPAPEEDIPEKYRGKSMQEIVRMHQAAESLIGRQGNEVGEMRSVINDILTHVQQPSTPAPEPKEEDAIDFFSDPAKYTESTVRKAIHSTPEIQELSNEVKQIRQERSAGALLRAHPDAYEVSNTPEFKAWVQQSPVRANMYEDAHRNFRSDVASELLSLYKERQSNAQRTVENADANREASINRASTGGGKSSAESRGKEILSRERLIELKRTDPDSYYAQMSVIKQAYAEGRVK